MVLELGFHFISLNFSSYFLGSHQHSIDFCSSEVFIISPLPSQLYPIYSSILIDLLFSAHSSREQLS